ncbi:MAG: hypothetical protein ACRC3H_19125 [Lachnospiraceae bacterium]
MGRGDNLKRDELPTMQQIRYLIELAKLGNERGCVALIAETCRVNHGSVSRYFKLCTEKGYLTKEYKFTNAGKTWLNSYIKLIKQLKNYLHRLGIADRETSDYIKKMIENLDYHILTSMLRIEQEMRSDFYTEKKSNSSKNFLRGILAYGNHEVYFMLYQQGKQADCDLSMANRGFKKPATLIHNKRGSWLELTICEMSAQSRINMFKLTGRLETLKYEQDGMLQLARIKEDKLRIPLDACNFRKKSGGELKGVISVMVTCSVGRVHMPESTALLVFWL